MIVPPGLKLGANRRLAGEDVARGAVALHAGRRLQPQDLSMAAALGLQSLAGTAARARRDLFHRRRDRRAGRAAAGRRALRCEPRTAARAARAARRRSERSRHPARRSRQACGAARGGGAGPRPRADLRRRLDRRGRLRARRDRDDRQAGVLARRDQAGAAGRDGRAAAARRSSGCRAIRSRCSSLSRAWCGRCCCDLRVRARSR